MRPDTRRASEPAFSPDTARLVRAGLIVLVVLGLGILVFAIVREMGHAAQTARWDELDRLEDDFERETGASNYFWTDPGGIVRPAIERHVRRLEAFLPRAEEESDALAPYVHWLIARYAADVALSYQDAADAASRRSWWERARTNWEVLRDRYPEFPVNLPMFAPRGKRTLTDEALSTIEANLAWETERLPTEKTPPTDVVVLIRTDRGDMRMGLYREDAPELVDRFLGLARSGAYDGTAFFSKSDRSDPGRPHDQSIRGGHPASRAMRPYEADSAVPTSQPEEPPLEPMLPALSRYRIQQVRGVVSAWHDPVREYESSYQIMVAVARSPALEHAFSPIGRLLDAASLETADRIFASATWQSDAEVTSATDERRSVRDFFQVPVRIVKVLVYEDGALSEAEAPSPDRAAIDESERRLESVVADALRVEPPPRPRREPARIPDDDSDGDGDEGTNGAGGEEESPPGGGADEPERPQDADEEPPPEKANDAEETAGP